MKTNELVLPEQYVELSEKEMEQVEGGIKGILDYVGEFLARRLKK